MSPLRSTPKITERLGTKGLPMCHTRTHYHTATSSGCGVRLHSSFHGSESPNPSRNRCLNSSINFLLPISRLIQKSTSLSDTSDSRCHLERLARIFSIGLQTICFTSVQTVRVCSELLLRVVFGVCWGMNTAPHQPVSGRGGNFCARVSLPRSPRSWWCWYMTSSSSGFRDSSTNRRPLRANRSTCHCTAAEPAT